MDEIECPHEGETEYYKEGTHDGVECLECGAVFLYDLATDGWRAKP